MGREITALAQWFGGNRMLADEAGKALDDCHWAGILFAGSMAEVLHIRARSILVNDQHKHVINLARVVADAGLRRELIHQLERKAFHPEELRLAQAVCRKREPNGRADLELAVAYFVSSWMGRGGKGGTIDEFNGRTATRWNANGGDSMTRYRSALRMIVPFSQTLRRCTFETMDGIDFAERCEDTPGHGLYADPPFPKQGRKYKYNAGKTEQAEANWHGRLARALSRFKSTRVVCRFYDHPLIRELYPEPGWEWKHFTGRKQSNADAPEVLLVRNGRQRSLFND